MLFQPVLSRWILLSIWTTWTVLSAHEPYCLGKITSYRAVKIGVRQKVILSESFDQKTIRFIQYCPYWKFWPKDNTVQPILSFKKIFTKKKYGSTHIVFWEKCWPKHNTVQPILSFENILTKRKYGSAHILFWEKLWPKDNTVQPILSFEKVFTKKKYGSTHIVF